MKGYSNKLTDLDKQFIYGYFILHLTAITRTNWERPWLKWLIKKHKELVDRCIEGKYVLR